MKKMIKIALLALTAAAAIHLVYFQLSGGSKEHGVSFENDSGVTLANSSPGI